MIERKSNVNETVKEDTASEAILKARAFVAEAVHVEIASSLRRAFGRSGWRRDQETLVTIVTTVLQCAARKNYHREIVDWMDVPPRKSCDVHNLAAISPEGGGPAKSSRRLPRVTAV